MTWPSTTSTSPFRAGSPLSPRVNFSPCLNSLRIYHQLAQKVELVKRKNLWIELTEWLCLCNHSHVPLLAYHFKALLFLTNYFIMAQFKHPRCVDFGRADLPRGKFLR